MNHQTIILNHNCFVCGDLLDENKISVCETTKFSDKQIFKYIETFVGIKFERNLFSQPSSASICLNCLDKLEEYDSICQIAARIQDEIAQCFKDNQEKCRTQDTKDFLQCKTCFAEFSEDDAMNEHFCEEQKLYEFVEELEDYAEESSEDFEPPQKQAKLSTSLCTYTCNTCNASFNKRRQYQAHIKLAHLPEDAEIFECSRCLNSVFVSDLELKLHNVTVHPVDPLATTFECPVCSKTFTTKALLNRHFGIHSAASDRPFVCDICGKSYFHYSSFQAHIKTHTNERDFACSQCSKTFRSQSHLNRHLKTHTKVKDHVCSECGSRFAERYNLTAHAKTHFGITRKKKSSGFVGYQAIHN